MIKLQTYAGLSLMATLAVVYHAFSSRLQFYPAMVYLSTSKISLVLLLNLGLANMCILWQLTKKIFLGTLREAEVERLNEQTWREVMEILFAITIFRQDFSVSFLAMVTALLLIKSLHWLAQKRVEYIETTPTVPLRSHVRIVSFMAFLLFIDSVFLYNNVKYLVLTKQASVSLFFSFEYMILATTTVSFFIKYVFYVSDMLMEGQWEKKAVYTFYLELIRDLLHLSMYLCFFLAIFVNYGVPLHLIRELYETFRNFKARIADYLRYRRITSNMNDRFPEATPEELSSSDATCIICREEMTTAKKLLCGHIFHVHCLRSWLERQHTCPTCRALVIPSDNGSTMAGSRGDINQQGTNNGGSSSHGSGRDDPVDGNISLHQARLQAVAAATSIYGKSFVYPSVNSPHGSVVNISNLQACRPSGSASSSSNGEQSFAGHTQHNQFPSMPFSSQFTYVPMPVTGGSIPSTEVSASDISMAVKQLEDQKNILERKIEVLQNQLKNFEEQCAKQGLAKDAVASSSSAQTDS